VFKNFRAGFPLYDMIGEVLKRFEIYLHQLTPNVIVRLNIYIWALRSHEKTANAEGFCRVHELHYQIKARADGLHKNFGCYNCISKRYEGPCDWIPHKMAYWLDRRVVLCQS
jgi:hypothetical protein